MKGSEIKNKRRTFTYCLTSSRYWDWYMSENEKNETEKLWA